MTAPPLEIALKRALGLYRPRYRLRTTARGSV